jgi:hypothetical protein
VDAIFVSDMQGRIIIDSTAYTGPSAGDGEGEGLGGGPNDAGTDSSAGRGRITQTSNVTISGSQVIRHMAQLKLGQVNAICAQYKDYVVVQFVDGVAVVTLIGRKCDYQCAGQLLALIPTMKGSSVFRDMSAAVKKGEE